MTFIKKLVDQIDEEICGAKDYAEKYIECKSEGNSNWAGKYKTMSEDELKHAMWLHDYAVQKINKLKEVYTAPAEMQEAWDKSHVHYVDKVAWIKQMLAM